MAFDLPDIWTLFGLILALIGLAAAMTSVPGPGHWEFRIARFCFIGATLLFLTKLGMWGAVDLTLFRIGIVAGCGALIAIGLAYAFQWIASKERNTTASATLSSVVTAPEATAASRPLRSLSNLQLRDATLVFAVKMRTFETNTDTTEIPFFKPGNTPEQNNAAWEAMIKRQMERSKQKQLSFSDNYLGQARELRDEITFRLREIGVVQPYIDITPIESIGPGAIENGVLSGPYPVTSAANYLEKLVRRLPQKP
jgi:hypothetical protein